MFNGSVRRIHGVSWRWTNHYEQGRFGRLQCREQMEMRHYCHAEVSSIGRTVVFVPGDSVISSESVDPATHRVSKKSHSIPQLVCVSELEAKEDPRTA